MSKLGVLVVSLTVFVLIRGSASAQVLLPGLPEVQSVNASGQLGTIWPTPFSTVPKTSVDNLDLWGWGVETEFHLPFNEGDRWEASLAVGYNQLSLGAHIDNGRTLRGTLRDLPALTLYFGRPKHSLYFGVTIAESELINGRLLRAVDPGMSAPDPIKVSAASFSAGVAVGYEAWPGFIELGYVGRYFPSLVYDGIPAGSFPADLGQRMYAGGFVLRLGGSLSLKRPNPPKTAIPCAGANAEIQTPAELDIDHRCSGDVLTVRFVKKPPAPAPQALPPQALPPQALPPQALPPQGPPPPGPPPVPPQGPSPPLIPAATDWRGSHVAAETAPAGD